MLIDFIRLTLSKDKIIDFFSKVTQYSSEILGRYSVRYK
jgi:hypothetical protein